MVSMAQYLGVSFGRYEIGGEIHCNGVAKKGSRGSTCYQAVCWRMGSRTGTMDWNCCRILVGSTRGHVVIRSGICETKGWALATTQRQT